MYVYSKYNPILFIILLVIRAYRLSNNNIWQWLITLRGKEIKSITIFPRSTKYSKLLQNFILSQKYIYIYNLYNDKTNYITNSPPIKYYPALLRISFDPTRKYNTYNAKPDKTNYHKFYRASFKKKKKKKFHSYKIQISHLEFQPYTFKTLCETSSRRESLDGTPVQFYFALARNLLLFFSETRLSLSLPIPVDADSWPI